MRLRPVVEVTARKSIFAFILGISQLATAAVTQAAGLWVNPLELDFGPVGVGTSAPQKVVTITNYGLTSLTSFAGGGLPSPFGVSQDCVPSVAPGGACHYYFTFSPTGEGTFTGTSSTSTSQGNIVIKVHGSGVGPKIVYDAHSLDMGTVVVGTDAAEQVVTLRNVGLAPVTSFAGGALSSPFAVSQDCASGLAPGGSCHYYLNFHPTAAGSFNATSSTSTNGGEVGIDVKGGGRASLSIGTGQRVSPLSLDFGPVGVGATSFELAAKIHNQSPFSTISNFAGGGVGAPFSASQDCASGVPPVGTCGFYYTFSPTTAGEFTATSNVSDSYGSFSVQLRGTGVAPSQSANPLWIDFGPQTINTTSQDQIVTITNTGLTPLTSWIGGGVAAPFSGSQDCADGLQPGASCSFYYTFTPTAEGFHTATSRISTEAGVITIALQGGVHATAYQIAATLTGSGQGTVSSEPAGISCSPACSGSFPAGGTVLLTATPAEFSAFNGWSGNCAGAGICSLIVTAAKAVTATFGLDSAHKTRVSVSDYYPTLTQAYLNASPVIEAWATDFTEDLTCDTEKTVSLSGGYNGDYTPGTGRYTALRGSLTLRRGSLTVSQLAIF